MTEQHRPGPRWLIRLRRRLRDQPIGRRLFLGMLLKSGLLLLITTLMFLWLQQLTLRRHIERDLLTLAEVVASNSTAALSFEDHSAASETLASLALRPGIRQACLFFPDPRPPLAVYRRDPELRCPAPAPGSAGPRLWQTDRLLQVQAPVRLDGQVLGQLLLSQDLGELRADMGRGLIAGLAILALAMMLSWGLSAALRRAITTPLEELTRAARKVAERREFSTRVPGSPRRDEIGVLVDSFNQMLRQIERGRLALETNHRYLEAILDTAPDAIITIDAGGHIERFNVAAERLFGYRAAEVVGRNVKCLMPAATAAAHDGYLRHYLETGEAHIIGIGREVIGRHRDGRPLPLELAVGEIHAGGRHAFAGILRDLSERKAGETALREANQALALQVREREQANVELQRAVQELRATQDQLVQTEKLASLGGLVAGVAHEINTPIGVAVTAASHLQEQSLALGLAYRDGELRRSSLEDFLAVCDQSTGIIVHNLGRAAQLIHGFKQVAVDQSSSERRRFRVCAYIDEVLLSLRPHLRQTSHRLEVDCPAGLEIESHPGALSQILTNLVMNSLLHAWPPEQAGQIQLRVRSTDDTWQLRYADNGRGIPPENEGRVFDPFFTTRRGEGGSGLGLHIVHNLVTQTLRGRIQLDNQPGRGLTLTLTLPLNLPGEAD